MHYKLSVQNSNSSPLDLSTPLFSPPTQTYFPIIPKYISRLLPLFQWVRRDCWLANLFCSAHWSCSSLLSWFLPIKKMWLSSRRLGLKYLLRGGLSLFASWRQSSFANHKEVLLRSITLTNLLFEGNLEIVIYD